MNEVLVQAKPTERESLLKNGSFNEFGVATDFKTKVKSLINYVKAYKFFINGITKQKAQISGLEVFGSMKKAFSLNAMSLLRQTEDAPRMGVYPLEIDLNEATTLNVNKDVKKNRQYPSDIDMHITVDSDNNIPGGLITKGSRANTYSRFGVYIQID